MRSLDEIFAEKFKKRNLEFNKKELATSALNYPAVKTFIAEHSEISQTVLTASLSNLYKFVQQKEHPDKIIAGYEPVLFFNKDLNLIEIRYTPTQNKRSKDSILSAKRRIELIDLPERLKDIDLNEIDQSPERKHVLNDLAEFINDFSKNKQAKGLYLAGDFGVGKTYMLAGLANLIAKNGYKIAFLHVPSFIASLSRHIKSNSLQDELEHLSSVPVLIFDDIGAETLSDWSRDDVLGVIFQKRMDNVLPTFFSSNISMDELEEHFAETKSGIDELKAKRLMQRVRFLSKEVIVTGPNRRGIL